MVTNKHIHFFLLFIRFMLFRSKSSRLLQVFYFLMSQTEINHLKQIVYLNITIVCIIIIFINMYIYSRCVKPKMDCCKINSI